MKKYKCIQNCSYSPGRIPVRFMAGFIYEISDEVLSMFGEGYFELYTGDEPAVNGLIQDTSDIENKKLKNINKK